MIKHICYEVAPWEVREHTLDLDVLAQSESVFALSNGHIGLRGNLEEGEPSGTKRWLQPLPPCFFGGPR